ncbi:hypothetical protein [Pseudomonas guariconensis]|uniref:hypothetical protein n=1 Tax=Pseudomonas guariconensis TaxID=1288410 RepID=UPI002D1F464D|nr:hypothetical protein [Pseudomonas guariconensis]MEB3840466.1 hypothetical protein [Pseudomonas guariconensis]MEB3873334.1 hypothetical protein [Pseudomonas guariconensis]MEB3879701.1 hypothetical protein [Pseudomonas guariconensis]MEB3895843.1 hypothetical protein [Pseudomonas guariconensis]
MNRLALITALITLSAPALAATGEETCKKISAMAGKAMEARQNGDLLEDAMATVGDQSKFSDAMVVKAYTAPVANSSDGKKKLVSDFRNAAYAECYTNIIEPMK